MTKTERWAERQADTLHYRASRHPNPVGFLREKLAEAETDYARTGDRFSLALVRVLERAFPKEL